ncbi:Deoxyribonuclease Tat-D [Golovinomyces cichoracearum]|uniref:Deoxyribonuclease Tat-D n=1 Tax=Golovinomyces cichoracearum TaxID=62708 RepID=A0A420I0T6_9PEZI|nr:Deoxyribonuclease Tat-D [Golovinomyces cichoracearum]
MLKYTAHAISKISFAISKQRQIFVVAPLSRRSSSNATVMAKSLTTENIENYEDEQKWCARFVDIGINLTDPVYQGIYNGTTRHPPDLASVIERAKRVNCRKMIITGSDLSSSQKAIELTQRYPKTCYATVGVHPCSCTNFIKGPTSAAIQLAELAALAQSAKNSGHVVSFGEIGLDYDRLELCSKDIQLEFFERQLTIAVQVQLPLFLHSRAAHSDFMRLLGAREAELPNRGVVHSFTGSKFEMEELVSRGWHIGINGCSLKTDANCEVVRAVPLHFLHLETDGPWCEIRPSHAGARILSSFENEKLEKSSVKILDPSIRWVKKEKWEEGCCVKGRNEPCAIPKVAWVVAGLKGVDVEVIIDAAWNNSMRMFNLGRQS